MNRWGQPRHSKYGASKITVKGRTFDSKYEAQRYLYLLDLEKKGKITNIRLQQSFRIIKKVVKLVPKQLKTKVRWEQRVVEKEAKYTCDFLYEEDGKVIVEEFKSKMTAQLPDYILRRKLMVNKIYDHNERPNRRHWVFREVIYYNQRKIIVEDK